MRYNVDATSNTNSNWDSLIISKVVLSKDSYRKPKQSANALFNFMRDIVYLKNILKNKYFVPRYFEEDVRYLNLEFSTVAYPMTCFCDINLQRIESHTEDYGKFAIGLYKEWCIKQGIQPIQYVNPSSPLAEDFTVAFQSAFSIKSEDIDIINLKDYLIGNMFYLKPLDGEMKRDGSPKQTKNFHDEREWRYIPSLKSTDMPSVLLKERNTPESRHIHNEALTHLENTWLKFSYETIKYLIVDNSNSRSELIKFVISDEIGVTDEEKYKLISKIVVFDEINEDW